MAARNFYFIACHEPINAGLLLDEKKKNKTLAQNEAYQYAQ